MHTLPIPAPRSAQRLLAALVVTVVVTLAIVVSILRLAGGTGTHVPSTSRLVPSQSFQVCVPHRPC